MGDPLPAPYTSAADAVSAEIGRIALRVRRALADARNSGRVGETTAYGWDRADRELARLEAPAREAPRLSDENVADLDKRLGDRERKNQHDRAAGRAAPIHRLAERAALTPQAFDLFLLALAPEVDEGFARVFALLRGGRGRGGALDVATAARIVAPGGVGAEQVRAALTAGAPLADLGLVERIGGDGTRADAVTMETSLAVPPSVVQHVLGLSPEETELRPFLAPRPAALPRDRVLVPDELFPRLEGLLKNPTALPILEGAPGAGKRRLLRSIAAEQQRPLIELDVAAAPEKFGMAESVAATRLAWLTGATLLIVLPGPEPGTAHWRAGVADLLRRCRTPIVLARSVENASHADLAVPTGRLLSPVIVPPPDAPLREAMWRDRLGTVDVIDFPMLARTYPITGGLIARIAAEARILATARADASAPITQPDVLEAIEAEFRPRLSTVGRRLKTSATYKDLILAEDTKESLAELEATIRLRDRVLDEWGLGRLVRGRGVSALFYGDPGTGKTMAAGVVARAAGLPLYQIDTAQVVSKWIGETEKNMSEVFRAAEAGHAMLLFDEADAIFGKRTDVNSSTDRYANMQTNFLLTQIEMFNGVCVLTTNRESVMDIAFQRRLSFRIQFPVPEAPQRVELWRTMLAQHGGADGEVELGKLAEWFEMSGGYIKNAVLRAAYLAADRGERISTDLLKHSAELVLRDAGKVVQSRSAR